MTDSSNSSVGWDGYVQRFHTDRPGVTEALLARSTDQHGRTAYDWVSDDLPEGVVVDVGCGSGPTRPMVDRWVGVDRSPAELEGARRRGRGPLVLASASLLPVRRRSVDAALAVMLLMVLSEPAAAVAEVSRVLRPGGVLKVLLPADGPLTVADRLRYGLLLAVLGHRAIPFPHPEVATDPNPLLAAAGFDIVADDSRRFRFTIADRDDAELFVGSLYLPALSVWRLRLARAVMWWVGRGSIGIPLRCIEARLTR